MTDYDNRDQMKLAAADADVSSRQVVSRLDLR